MEGDLVADLKSSVYFGGVGLVPTEIVNASSEGGFSMSVMTVRNGKPILSGALTADTYADVLSITGGGGVLELASTFTLDTTSRTHGLRIVIDGNEVFNAITDTTTAIGLGLVGAGSVGEGNFVTPSARYEWEDSLLIQVKSSLTETDKIRTYVEYIRT